MYMYELQFHKCHGTANYHAICQYSVFFYKYAYLLSSQSNISLGNAEGFKQGLLRAGAEPGQSLLLLEGHQVRAGELPRALPTALQV